MRYIGIDIETDGLDPAVNNIMEIGLVTYSCDREFLYEKQWFVKCDKSKRPKKFSETEWDKILDGTPVKKAVHEVYNELAFDDTLVGHFIVFDLRFLNYHAGLSGYQFDFNYEDTLGMSHKFYKNRKYQWSLPKMCRFFGIKKKRSHRALNDAHAAMQLFFKLLG